MEAWARPVGNLSAAAATNRLRGGIIMLAVALAGAVVMVYTHLHPMWRAVLLVPFFFAANGFYQGLHRT
jgi:hypothetical protein